MFSSRLWLVLVSASVIVFTFPAAASAANPYLTIDDARVETVDGTAYLYVTWTLKTKVDLINTNHDFQVVSFAPSLNGNFANRGQFSFSGTEAQRMLNVNLDGNAVYPQTTWHEGSCNEAIANEGEYRLNTQYVTRIRRIYDAASSLPRNAADITEGDTLRFSIFVFPWCNQGGDQPYHADTEDYPIDISALEPVVFVPGILGTRLNRASDGEEVWPNEFKLPFAGDEYLNDLQLKDDGTETLSYKIKVGNILDQILRYNVYQNILVFLQNNIATSTLLFQNPYDWRFDLGTTAMGLNQKIQDAARVSPTGKVNIVAHSMGGLLTKEYLRQSASASLIDKVIFVGTPHLGAPKAGKLLLYGDDLDINFAGLGLNPLEAKKIAQNMPAVYQLLPSQKYFSISGGYIIDARSSAVGGSAVLSFNETKNFFGAASLNQTLLTRGDTFHQALDNFTFPSGIKTYNIVGCGNADTIGKMIVLDRGKYNLVYTLGDKTVPLESAVAVGSQNKLYYSNAKHSSLVKDSGALNRIEAILNNDPDAWLSGTATTTASNCAFGKKLGFSSHSPVYLHIYDGQNRHVGPNAVGDIEYGISDSSYDSIGDNNFVTVPDTATSTYRIVLSAYASGTFDFDISTLTGSTVTSKISYLNQPLLTASSTATLTYASGSGTPQLSIDHQGDGIPDITVPPTAMVSGFGSSDIAPPIIDIQSPTDLEYGRNEMVVVAATASDSESGLALFEIKLDGAMLATSTIDLFYKPLGTHILNFLAYDRAGNPREISQQFTSLADATSTIADIERAFALGWIKKNDTKNSLIKDLRVIMKFEKKIIKLEGKLPQAVLGKLTPEQRTQKKIEKLQAKIDKILGKNFLKELEKKYKNGGIAPGAYNLLKEDVEWMMAN